MPASVSVNLRGRDNYPVGDFKLRYSLLNGADYSDLADFTEGMSIAADFKLALCLTSDGSRVTSNVLDAPAVIAEVLWRIDDIPTRSGNTYPPYDIYAADAKVDVSELGPGQHWLTAVVHYVHGVDVTITRVFHVQGAITIGAPTITGVAATPAPQVSATGGPFNATVTPGVVAASASVPVPSLGVTTKLRWAPPTLAAGYDVWNVPATGTANRTRGSRTIIDRDLLVVMPNSVIDGTVTTLGFRNIVMIGGHVKINSGNTSQFTLRLDGWAGTAHVEGVVVDANGHSYTGSGVYTDAIRCITPHAGTAIQFQNLRVLNVDGYLAGPHGDMIQTWSGPVDMRIHRMTGYGRYQGLFLAPMDVAFTHYFTSVNPYVMYEMDLHFDADGSTLYTLANKGWSGTLPQVQGGNVWGEHWPGTTKDAFDGHFNNVKNYGSPPGGEFVTAAQAGLNYVSPGYLS